MIKILYMLIMIGISLPESFKSTREINIEKNLVAPCCLGGTIHGHDDNTYTVGIKSLISELVQKNIDKEKLFKIYNDLYKPSSGIYQIDLPPIISSVDIGTLFRKIERSMSDKEILSLFASIHGNHILSDPPSNIYGVWLIPLICFFIGVFIIVSFISKKTIK